MCCRVFLSTVAPLDAVTSVDFTLCAASDAASVPTRLGGHVVEALAYGGCACGFSAQDVGFGLEVWSRRAAFALVAMATDREREELEASTRAVAGLLRAIGTGLGSGPVRLYTCWYGSEDVAFAEQRSTSFEALVELTDRLEPFDEHVVYEIAASALAVPAGA